MEKPSRKFISIAELVELNPPIPLQGVAETTEVSFIPMSDVSESGRWKTKQTRLLNEVKKGYTQFQEGDVLFAKITPCMENGKGCHAIGLKNGIGFGTTEFHVLRAKNSADPRFIFHVTQSTELRLNATTKMTGSAGQQRVPASFFTEYKILAFELTEQAEIADVFSSIDKAIEQTEQLIQKQKRIERGLLLDLLTCGIDEHGGIRSEVTHDFKDSPLGRIPKDWDVMPTGNLFEMILGKMLNKDAKSGEHQFPYLANRNVLWDSVDLSDLETMSFSVYERQKLELKFGDLLVCEGGAVGRTAMWREEMPDCYFQKAIHRLRARQELILPEFMLNFMRLADEKGLFTDLITQTSIAHLTQEKLALLRVPLPTIEEQKRIIKVLGQTRESLLNDETKLNKLLSFKKGLMQDLLSGKVRVKAKI